MRSIYRIKRAAIASGSIARTPVLRNISTSVLRAAEANPATSHDRSELDRFEASSSRSSRWSDAAFPNESSSSQAGFFTPSQPRRYLAPPPSQTDQETLRDLHPLLHYHPDRRDDEFCKHVWRLYYRLAPSTRRSLHPSTMRMLLRAVIPNRAQRVDFKKKAKDPIQAFGARSEKLEQRLQVIMADMNRSTWTPSGDKDVAVAPQPEDYRYIMKVLGQFGHVEACEAIYREMNDEANTDISMSQSVRTQIMIYRLEALKVWTTERVNRSSWTRNRTTHLAGSDTRSLRYRPQSEIKRPGETAIAVIWDIMRHLEENDTVQVAGAMTSQLHYQLVVTLRQLLAFLPETEVTVIAIVRKILRQTLEKGYGIDFRFLRQIPDGGFPTILPEVLDSAVYLMGTEGDVYRMVAMYEALSDADSARAGSRAVEAAASLDNEGMGETLSDALKAEAASRDGLDWLGRAKAVVADAGQVSSSSTPRESPVTESSMSRRPFEEFLPSIQAARTDIPPESGSSAIHVGQDGYPALARTATITIMLNAIKQAGNADLALHVLRSSLRDLSLAREAWLGALLQADANSTPTLPKRSLLISAKWFEAAQLLARTQPNASWIAEQLRTLMTQQLQALNEEHLILTQSEPSPDEPIGMESLLESAPSAPIHRIATLQKGHIKSFDPSKHLHHLHVTHRDISRLLLTSQRQVEKIKESKKLQNARRAERRMEAARAEAEKLEAKKANRRVRRDEMSEVPLALA